MERVFGIRAYITIAKLLCRLWDSTSMAKRKKQEKVIRHEDDEKFKTEILRKGGWLCEQCGQANPVYTGTCSCGTKKTRRNKVVRNEIIIV